MDFKNPISIHLKEHGNSLSEKCFSGMQVVDEVQNLECHDLLLNQSLTL